MNPTMTQHLSRFTGVAARKRFAVITAALTVTVERHISTSTTAAGAAFAVTLPAPQDVAGEDFFIEMTARNGSKDVTITNGDRGGDIVLNAADERVVIKSTGPEYIMTYIVGPSEA